MGRTSVPSWRQLNSLVLGTALTASLTKELWAVISGFEYQSELKIWDSIFSSVSARGRGFSLQRDIWCSSPLQIKPRGVEWKKLLWEPLSYAAKDCHSWSDPLEVHGRETGTFVEQSWKTLHPQRCSRTGWIELWTAWSGERCPCVWQGSGTRWSFKVPSPSNHDSIWTAPIKLEGFGPTGLRVIVRLSGLRCGLDVLGLCHGYTSESCHLPPSCF